MRGGPNATENDQFGRRGIARGDVGGLGDTSCECRAADPGTTGFYQVTGTTGPGLAEQSKPAIHNFIVWAPEHATVKVICQVNDGGQDLGDGPFAQWQLSRTWDEIGTNVWVYDHFINTPAQDGFGWSLNTGCNGEHPH